MQSMPAIPVFLISVLSINAVLEGASPSAESSAVKLNTQQRLHLADL